MNTNTHSFILALGCTLTLCSNPVDADEELERRFKNEAPRAWAQLGEFYRNLEGRVIRSSVREFRDTKKMQIVEWDSKFKINGEKVILHTKTDRSERIRGFNPDKNYYFTLGQKEKGGEFMIANLGAADRDNYLWECGHLLDFSIHAPYSIFDHSLDSVLANNPAALGKPERDPENPELVRFSYALTLSKDLRTGKVVKKNGHAIVDPRKLWAIQKLTTTEEWGHWELKIEYEGEKGGIPRIKKMVSIPHGLPSADQVVTITVKDLKHRKIPEKDFTLSAFGLPEVPVRR